MHILLIVVVVMILIPIAFVLLLATLLEVLRLGVNSFSKGENENQEATKEKKKEPNEKQLVDVYELYELVNGYEKLHEEIKNLNEDIKYWNLGLSDAKTTEEREIIDILNSKINQAIAMVKKYAELSNVEKTEATKVLEEFVQELAREIRSTNWKVSEKRKKEIHQKFKEKADRVLEKN